MDNQERIIKAIKFFRHFKSKSDSDIYRRSVLKFCDIVEQEMITPTPTANETAENIKATMF